jgi:hypothetical protein
MNSGIYRYTFDSGAYYIGKSNNIDRRWEEHRTKLAKGTAASRVQHQYNLEGMPSFEVICYCHEDHIDLMESYYINDAWYKFGQDGHLLNTTKPTLLPNYEYQVLVDNIDLLGRSTVSHILSIRALEYEQQQRDREYEQLIIKEIVAKTEIEKELKKLQSSEGLNELLTDLKNITKERDSLKLELDKEKNKTFWQRLFS